MNTDPDKAAEIAKASLIEKYMAVVSEWSELTLEERKLQEREAQIKARKETILELTNDFETAAKVFGFDMNEAMTAHLNLSDSAPSLPSQPSDQAERKASGKISIKKFVLRAAQAAHPNPVRAASIRSDLASQGEEVHEKTVGMTLYRLLKNGELRREGYDWYFVPENERTAQEEGAEA